MDHNKSVDEHEYSKMPSQPAIVSKSGRNAFESNVSLTCFEKMSVPIKQYSNKFFRDIDAENHLLSNQSQQYQNGNFKKNNFIRRKQMFGKQQSMKQNRQTSSFSKHRELLAVNCCEQKRQRIKTQAAKSHTFAISQGKSSINELQQELVMGDKVKQIQTLFKSNLLSPCPSHFLNNRHTQPLTTSIKKELELMLKEEGPQKISQSRALELFSKIYKKQKSCIVQKLMKQSPKTLKKGISRQLQPKHLKTQIKNTQNRNPQTKNIQNNNIQTKKIYPIQKSKKQHLLKYLDKKQKIIRAPMRLINNRLPQKDNVLKSIKNTLQNQEEEFYQLNGWDTTI